MDMGQIIVSLNPVMSKLQQLMVTAILPLLALTTFIAALMMAIRLQSSRDARPTDAPGKAISYLAVAVFAAHFASFSSGIWENLTGQAGNQSLMFTYQTPSVPAQFQEVIQACLRFIALMGWYFAAKGLFLAKQITEGSAANNGESGVGKIATHFLGGVACINIDKFLPMLAQSAGFSI